jgi:hypothetical protein
MHRYRPGIPIGSAIDLRELRHARSGKSLAPPAGSKDECWMLPAPALPGQIVFCKRLRVESAFGYGDAITEVDGRFVRDIARASQRVVSRKFCQPLTNERSPARRSEEWTSLSVSPHCRASRQPWAAFDWPRGGRRSGKPLANVSVGIMGLPAPSRLHVGTDRGGRDIRKSFRQASAISI